jgi:hypothetical protein
MNDLFAVFTEFLSDLPDDSPLWRTADKVYTVKEMREHFTARTVEAETYILDTLRVSRDIIRAPKRKDKRTELQEWMDRYGEVRDALHFRKIRGEALTEKELTLLRLLDDQLSQLLPPPAPLPREVQNALADAHILMLRDAKADGHN